MTAANQLTAQPVLSSKTTLFRGHSSRSPCSVAKGDGAIWSCRSMWHPFAVSISRPSRTSIPVLLCRLDSWQCLRANSVPTWRSTFMSSPLGSTYRGSKRHGKKSLTQKAFSEHVLCLSRASAFCKSSSWRRSSGRQRPTSTDFATDATVNFRHTMAVFSRDTLSLVNTPADRRLRGPRIMLSTTDGACLRCWAEWRQDTVARKCP